MLDKDCHQTASRESLVISKKLRETASRLIERSLNESEVKKVFFAD